MSEAMIIGLLSLLGTLAGTFGGILTANKLMAYRLDKLEENMKKMESNTDRIYQLELHNAVQDTRIDDIADEVEKVRKVVEHGN